jgi:ribosomal protein L33
MLEVTAFCKFCKNVLSYRDGGQHHRIARGRNANILNKENKSKPQDIISFNFLINENNTHLETHFYKNSELLTVPDKFFCQRFWTLRKNRKNDQPRSSHNNVEQ